MNPNMAVIGFLAAAVVACGVQTCRLDTVTEKLATAQAARETAVAANESNMTTIDDLQDALLTCRSNRDADAVATAEAVAAVEIKAASLASELADLKRERLNDYETDADYRDWADRLVPVSTERRLRDLAARRDQDGNRPD